MYLLQVAASPATQADPVSPEPMESPEFPALQDSQVSHPSRDYSNRSSLQEPPVVLPSSVRNSTFPRVIPALPVLLDLRVPLELPVSPADPATPDDPETTVRHLFPV